MKNTFLYRISLILLIFALANCENEDKLRVNFDDLETSGGIFAQVVNQNGETDILFNNPSATNFDLNYQIVSSTGKFEIQEVRFYVSFTDNTTEVEDLSASETLIKSFSSFDTSQQYPQFTASFTGDEILSEFGLVADDISGSDSFNFRVEIETDKGIFSDVSANFDNQSADHTFTSNVVCPSELDVEFNFSATNFTLFGNDPTIYGLPPATDPLTGTDSFVRTSGSTYVTESGLFDFGYYCNIWNGLPDASCGDGADGDLQLQEVCGNLTYIGADQFGDAWTISNVSVVGNDLTFTWESAYGESSTVTLTRTDGQNWPNTLFAE